MYTFFLWDSIHLWKYSPLFEWEKSHLSLGFQISGQRVTIIFSERQQTIIINGIQCQHRAGGLSCEFRILRVFTHYVDKWGINWRGIFLSVMDGTDDTRFLCFEQCHTVLVIESKIWSHLIPDYSIMVRSYTLKPIQLPNRLWYAFPYLLWFKRLHFTIF